jgi:uncharacterized protein (DUF952 family)
MILCTCMQWITETATNFFIGRHELMLAKVERLGESLKFFTSMQHLRFSPERSTLVVYL